MDRLTARLRLVTPMFLPGADQTSAGLRAPSIKGALRFWYRALHPRADPRDECHPFGGADKESGQSGFLLRLPRTGDLRRGEVGDPRWEGSNVAYLGYGPIDRRPAGESRYRNGRKGVWSHA